VIKVGKLDKV
jgi:hypothetical protein